MADQRQRTLSELNKLLITSLFLLKSASNTSIQLNIALEKLNFLVNSSEHGFLKHLNRESGAIPFSPEQKINLNLYGTEEGSNSMKNEERKFLAKIVIIVVFGLLVAKYGNWLTEKVRQQTIEEAVLIESDEDGYTLSFNGEYHVYTYD